MVPIFEQPTEKSGEEKSILVSAGDCDNPEETEISRADFNGRAPLTFAANEACARDGAADDLPEQCAPTHSCLQTALRRCSAPERRRCRRTAAQRAGRPHSFVVGRISKRSQKKMAEGSARTKYVNKDDSARPRP
ncbi:hypothetical protein MTO96_010096 [Rhipicephalus appendiculatus]